MDQLTRNQTGAPKLLMPQATAYLSPEFYRVGLLSLFCTNDSSHGRNALILSLNSSSPGEKILPVRIENEKRIDDALFGNISF